MNKLSLFAVAALSAPVFTTAFAPLPSSNVAVSQFSAETKKIASSSSSSTLILNKQQKPLFADNDEGASESVFIAAEESSEKESSPEEKIGLEVAEQLGRGAAKKKRGRRRGSSTGKPSAPPKSTATLEAEEVFYEGPPSITETIIPTISILTVVGIIPAAASWARQAWVRYKITSRRIRVNSGVNGKDMSEIVYPDITEIRTVNRLLGDGDVVFFLSDGAKFEMRNIPKFTETMDFILDKVNPDVVKKYKEEGDVTKG